MKVLSLPTAGERFGRVLATRRAGEFEFRLSRYPAGLEIPPHRHPNAYFSFVVAGGMEERTGAVRSERRSDTVHLHPAGEPHQGRMGADGLLNLSVIPGGEMAARIAERLRRVPAAVGGDGLHIVASRCWSAFRDADAETLALEAAALELAAALLRWSRRVGSGMAPRWLERVRTELERDPAAGTSLHELAALAGVHEVYLARAFRRHLGESPGGYRRRLRIQTACAWLRRGDLPLVEIALACGFSSQSHFTRVFTRVIGVTPGAYRRRELRRPA